MYAAYQADGPMRQALPATSFHNSRFHEDAGRPFPKPVAGFGYRLMATMGLLTPDFFQERTTAAAWQINQVKPEQTSAHAVEITSHAAEISRVREVMNISVTEFAKTFGVSRQAVHEWMNGGALSTRNAVRLAELVQVAAVFESAGINVQASMLRRKVAGGPSVLESMEEEGKAVAQARLLVPTLVREGQQRQRLAERLAGRPKAVLSADAFGIPHLAEDF